MCVCVCVYVKVSVCVFSLLGYSVSLSKFVLSVGTWRKSHVAISHFKGQKSSGKGAATKRDEQETGPEFIQVLLLLIQHGANGLNLLEARHVILIEPLLNSAAEAQAISRVHRIGQHRQTLVHRFLVWSIFLLSYVWFVQSWSLMWCNYDIIKCF